MIVRKHLSFGASGERVELAVYILLETQRFHRLVHQSLRALVAEPAETREHSEDVAHYKNEATFCPFAGNS